MPEQDKNSFFPQTSLSGFKFTDFDKLHKKLKAESSLRNAEQMSSWFLISEEDQHYTYMKCRVVPTCRAYIKSLFIEGDGFTVEEVNNKHDHEVRDERQVKIEQLKAHHILSPFIEEFYPTKMQKQLISGPYSVKTNVCCKTNPGETAIAYIITDPTGSIVLRKCFKFEELTNNQAEFMVIMLSFLDCYVNGMEDIVVYSRSKLVVGFMTGASKVSAVNLRSVAEAAKLLVNRLEMAIDYRVTFESSTGLQNVCRKSLGMKEIMGK